MGVKNLRCAAVGVTVSLIGLMALAGAVMLSVNSTEAARGARAGGSTASIALVQSSVHMGDSATFNSSGGSRISVACYQGGLGSMVYSADQPTGTTFLLTANSTWTATGGDALCYAWLYARSLSKGSLASTTFTAAAP